MILDIVVSVLILSYIAVAIWEFYFYIIRVPNFIPAWPKLYLLFEILLISASWPLFLLYNYFHKGPIPQQTDRKEDA